MAFAEVGGAMPGASPQPKRTSACLVLNGMARSPGPLRNRDVQYLFVSNIVRRAAYYIRSRAGSASHRQPAGQPLLHQPGD